MGSYTRYIKYHYLCTSEVPMNHLCGEDVRGTPASSLGVGYRFQSTCLLHAYLLSKYSYIRLLGFGRRGHVLS